MTTTHLARLMDWIDENQFSVQIGMIAMVAVALFGLLGAAFCRVGI